MGKLASWVAFCCLLVGLCLWVMAGPEAPRHNPWIIGFFVGYSTVAPIGAYWMLYQAIRYEEHPWPFIVLAFLPCSFFWYYFERVRNQERIRARS